MKKVIALLTIVTFFGIYVWTVDTIDANSPSGGSPSWMNPFSVVTDVDGLEFIPDCSRCERVRLVSCRRTKCYYRCTRTCRDINGTAYHETVKFALPGNR